MCISHINLVGFCSVLLQLMLPNRVQQALVSTRVNSSMSTRGQHVCVSLLLASGVTQLCWAGYTLGFAMYF